MICKNCGTENAEGDVFCKTCGNILSERSDIKNEELDATVSASSVNLNAEPEAETGPETETTGGAFVEDAEGSDNTSAAGTADDEDDPFKVDYKKKKKKKKRIIILTSVLVVLALLAGAAVLFWAELVNFVKGMGSPADHQAYVYSELSDEMTEIYKTYVVDALDGFGDQSTEAQITFEVSDTVISMLQGLGDSFAGLELDSDTVNSSKIGYSSTYKDGVYAISFDIDDEASEEPVAVDLILDLNNSRIVFDAPAIASKALELSISEEEGGASPIEKLEFLISFIPGEKLAEEVLPEYIEVIFSQMKDVTRETEEYTINGRKCEATCFTTRLDDKTFENIANAVCDTFKNDKAMKDHIVGKLSEAIDNGNSSMIAELIYGENAEEKHEKLSAEEYYDALIKKIAEPDESEVSEDEDNEGSAVVILKTYINSKGEILAVSLGEEESGQGIFYAYEADGDNVELELRILGEVDLDLGIGEEDGEDHDYEELSAESDLTEITISAKGSCKENKFTGTADITGTGLGIGDSDKEQKILSIDFKNFDTELYKKGIINGQMTFKSDLLGEFIASQAGEFTGSELLSLLSITVDAKNTEKTTDTIIKIGAGMQDFITVNIDGQATEPKEIEIPEKTVSDLEDWVMSFSPEILLPLYQAIGQSGNDLEI